MFGLASLQMTALSRYEAALDRALNAAHTTRRRGEAVSAPMEIHVEGPESALADLLTAADSKNYETKPISLEKLAIVISQAE